MSFLLLYYCKNKNIKEKVSWVPMLFGSNGQLDRRNRLRETVQPDCHWTVSRRLGVKVFPARDWPVLLPDCPKDFLKMCTPHKSQPVDSSFQPQFSHQSSPEFVMYYANVWISIMVLVSLLFLWFLSLILKSFLSTHSNFNICRLYPCL